MRLRLLIACSWLSVMAVPAVAAPLLPPGEGVYAISGTITGIGDRLSALLPDINPGDPFTGLITITRIDPSLPEAFFTDIAIDVEDLTLTMRWFARITPEMYGILNTRASGLGDDFHGYMEDMWFWYPTDERAGRFTSVFFAFAQPNIGYTGFVDSFGGEFAGLTAVPEPSTLLLAAMGAACLGARYRRARSGQPEELH